MQPSSRIIVIGHDGSRLCMTSPSSPPPPTNNLVVDMVFRDQCGNPFIHPVEIGLDVHVYVDKTGNTPVRGIPDSPKPAQNDKPNDDVPTSHGNLTWAQDVSNETCAGFAGAGDGLWMISGHKQYASIICKRHCPMNDVEPSDLKKEHQDKSQSTDCDSASSNPTETDAWMEIE